MYVKQKATLRKTCISNLPVEEIKKRGSEYVATVNFPLAGVDLIPIAKWNEIIEKWKRLRDPYDERLRLHLRQFFGYSKPYDTNEDGPKLYIEVSDLIGKPGDKLDVFWSDEEGCWMIRNPKKKTKVLQPL